MAWAIGRRRVVRYVGISAALGLVSSVLVAWVAAALRPSDGYPNALGTPADWESKYLMPQHRARTQWGDLFVDVDGSAFATDVGLSPAWARRSIPDWLLTTYPYPENVNPEYVALYHNPRYEIPSWAARPDGQSTEQNCVTTAWGWPALCLSGIERKYSSYAPNGKFLGSSSVLHGYWVFSGRPETMRLRRLPVRPVWPGLLVDSTAFGAVWLGLMLCFATLYSRRSRLGHCPRCGYDLKHDLAAGCPECGWGRAEAA
jgi:hypothetical protein